jgi:hypothetical protein
METYCYSINEALGYGVRVVRTPLTVAKEFKIPKSAELLLDWDCKNVEKIVEKMFEPNTKFDYKPPKDGWEGVLVAEPSDYRFEDEKVLVKPIHAYYDILLERHVSVWTAPFQVDEARARELVRKKLVRAI